MGVRAVSCKLREALRGARKIEWLILTVAVAAALLLLLPSGSERADTSGETELERRLRDTLCRIEGAGDVRVMVTGGEGTEEVVGVLIVAEGAEDARVQLEILRAVRTLLAIESQQIEITQMRRDGG